MDAIIKSWNQGAAPFDPATSQDWLKLTAQAHEAGGVLALDPRDPAQAAHIEARLGEDSHLAAHFPRKAAMMAATAGIYDLYGAPPRRTLLEMTPEQAAHRTLHPYVGITHFARHPGANAVVATGVISHPQTLHALEMVLEVVDAETGELVGSTSIPPQFSTTYQRATVTAPLPDDGKPRTLVAGLTTNYVVDGEPFASPMLAAAKLQGEAGIAVVTPFAPTPIKHPGATVVKIAIDRDGSDVDYSFQGITPPNEVMVPFSGEAQLASGYLVAQPPCQTGTLVLIAQAGGTLAGGAQFAMAQSDVIAAFAASQGQVATWSMGPDWQQTFQNFLSGNSTFDIQLQATLNVTSGGVPTTVPLSVSSTGPVSPGGSLYPINIQWGCVAPWMRVRLAEGVERQIGELQAGDLVLADGSGRVALVERVITGVETEPMWRLAVGGRELLATHNHPLMTPDGAQPISALRAGDTVLTADGPAMIERNAAEPYDGKVVNLVLAFPDGVLPLRGDYFICEGVVTGDNRVQNLIAHRTVPAHIPEEWQFDAANAARLAAGAALLTR
ncbi:hypothetical protein MZO42_07085 [Sphingomonas psychrotolerans]|uniref:Hint domain-containing protein n=1 Tax=Sphingomonas psychrotolerans TaxID=1327635 RepID=A0ABU3N2J3_9SPHN|nr:Hint domain-containing protein [Sphingomonas psychrotolerans]MDT8758456.1 hypothetical protein [Sphingomonas psychrotolerans]